jgi:hypothetical protein
LIPCDLTCGRVIGDNGIRVGRDDDRPIDEGWCGVYVVIFGTVCALTPSGFSYIGVKTMQKALPVADVQVALINRWRGINPFPLGSVWAEGSQNLTGAGA